MPRRGEEWKGYPFCSLKIWQKKRTVSSYAYVYVLPTAPVLRRAPKSRAMRRNERDKQKPIEPLRKAEQIRRGRLSLSHATPLGPGAPSKPDLVGARPTSALAVSFATFPHERSSAATSTPQNPVQSRRLDKIPSTQSSQAQAMKMSSPSSESPSAAEGGVNLAFDGTGGRVEEEAAIADVADRRIASFSSQSALTDSSPTCVGDLFHGQSTRATESSEVRKVTTVEDDASPGDGGCAAFGGLFGKCCENAVCVDQEGVSNDLEETVETAGADIIDQDVNHEVDLRDHLVLMRKSKSTKKKKKRKKSRTKLQLPKVNLNTNKFHLIKSVLSSDDSKGGKATAAIARGKSKTDGKTTAAIARGKSKTDGKATAAIARGESKIANDATVEGSKQSVAGDTVSRSTSYQSIMTEMVADCDTNQIAQAVPPVESDRQETGSDGEGKKAEPDSDRQHKDEDIECEGSESTENAPIVVDDKMQAVVIDETRIYEPNKPLPEEAGKVTDAPSARSSNSDDDEDTAATSAADSANQGDSSISVFRPPADSKEDLASLETDIKTEIAETEKADGSKPGCEYRQAKVTLRFKALAGLSVSRKKGKLREGKDVKVVVTYKQNTTSSDGFTSTNVSWFRFDCISISSCAEMRPFFPLDPIPARSLGGGRSEKRESFRQVARERTRRRFGHIDGHARVESCSDKKCRKGPTNFTQSQGQQKGRGTRQRQSPREGGLPRFIIRSIRAQAFGLGDWAHARSE